MKKARLKFFEKRLLEERKELLAELGHLEEICNQTQRESAGDLSAYSFHPADLGSDAIEREKAFLLASAEGRSLWEIMEALRKISSGNEYGMCEECGQEISEERLTVIPHARYCVTCQEKYERG
jgi:DnaK suppressor protein